MRAKSLQSCLTLWTVALQALLSMGFARQEYWSGLTCLLSRDLSNPGIEPASLMPPALVGRFFTTSTTWKDLTGHWENVHQNHNEVPLHSY